MMRDLVIDDIVQKITMSAKNIDPSKVRMILEKRSDDDLDKLSHACRDKAPRNLWMTFIKLVRKL